MFHGDLIQDMFFQESDSLHANTSLFPDKQGFGQQSVHAPSSDLALADSLTIDDVPRDANFLGEDVHTNSDSVAHSPTHSSAGSETRRRTSAAALFSDPSSPAKTAATESRAAPRKSARGARAKSSSSTPATLPVVGCSGKSEQSASSSHLDNTSSCSSDDGAPNTHSATSSKRASRDSAGLQKSGKRGKGKGDDDEEEDKKGKKESTSTSSHASEAASARSNLECRYCHKKFTTKAHVRRHERIHTGEKPFKCKYCDKAFNQRGNLNVHERTHTGERPFQCRYCGKRFTTSSYLHVHERSHVEQQHANRAKALAFGTTSHQPHATPFLMAPSQHLPAPLPGHPPLIHPERTLQHGPLFGHGSSQFDAHLLNFQPSQHLHQPLAPFAPATQPQLLQDYLRVLPQPPMSLPTGLQSTQPTAPPASLHQHQSMGTFQSQSSPAFASMGQPSHAAIQPGQSAPMSLMQLLQQPTPSQTQFVNSPPQMPIPAPSTTAMNPVALGSSTASSSL